MTLLRTQEEALTNLPDFLQSYGELARHIRAQFYGLTTVETADKFVILTQKLAPQISICSGFEVPIVNSKRSHDKGVDLFADGRDGSSNLYIQSKLAIDDTPELDTIFSKFENYLGERKRRPDGQQYLINPDTACYG